MQTASRNTALIQILYLIRYDFVKGGNHPWQRKRRREGNKKLTENAAAPAYGSKYSAGADLYAVEAVIIKPDSQ